MQYIKAFCASAIMAVGLTACTDDYFDKGKYAGRDIVFSVSDGDMPEAGSRGAATNRYSGTTALKSEADTLYMTGYCSQGIAQEPSSRAAGDAPALGIYGMVDGKAYMDNVAVKNAGEYWAPEHSFYWPKGKAVEFHTYGPYTEEPGSEGITSLPAANEVGEYQLSFTVPQRPEEQQDLTYSPAVTASASPCGIELHHALTAIKFAVGSTLPACKVKQIAITGVKYKGILNLDTGEWESVEPTSNDYVLECNQELPASADGVYANENAPITWNEGKQNTLLLMPQQLDENAQISLTIEWAKKGESEAKEYTFTSSLNNKEWLPGTTMVYRLSANPGLPQLIFKVIDTKTGMPLKTIRPGYAGGQKDYRIVSQFDAGDGSEPTPVPWTAELYKDGERTTVEEFNKEFGNISVFEDKGVGNEQECKVITVLPYPDFSGGMSDHTKALREAPAIGSPENPKNLADIKIYTSDPDKGPTGAPTKTINTSNCYLVNAPGTYSIPLVYGNAIQSGAEFAYSYVYKDIGLYNYAGNYISSPYITTDTGEKYGQPKLIWSDQLNVISNIRLSESGTEAKKMIVFDVDRRNIRQCNAVVAITDTKGEVMWSWHIWVTDMATTNEEDYIPMPCPDTAHNAHRHYLFHTNIGHIYEGDVVAFHTPELTIKYTQDLTGLDVTGNIEVSSHTITLQQDSYLCEQNEYFLLYQFGRKDPFVPGVNKIYDGNNSPITTAGRVNGFPTFRYIINDEKVGTGTNAYWAGNHRESMAYTIKHPEQFMESIIEFNDKMVASIQTGVWNISGSTTEFEFGAGGSARVPYKSVYDPCPVGCKLPYGDWVKQLAIGADMPNRKLNDLTVSWCYNKIGKQYTLFNYTYLNKTQEIFIYATGYRNPLGIWVDVASNPDWYIWLGNGVDSQLGLATAVYGRLKSNGEVEVGTERKTFTHAYGVRPMHVEDKTHHNFE